MEKALGEFFNKLNDEQKEKAKECKTLDELMAFAGKEGIELPDEMLDNVAGGFQVEWHKVDMNQSDYDPTLDQNTEPVANLMLDSFRNH